MISLSFPFRNEKPGTTIVLVGKYTENRYWPFNLLVQVVWIMWEIVLDRVFFFTWLKSSCGMKVDLLYETYHTYYYIWICPYIRFQSCNMPYYKWPRDAQGKQFNNSLQGFHFELHNNYFGRVNGNVFS